MHGANDTLLHLFFLLMLIGVTRGNDAALPASKSLYRLLLVSLIVFSVHKLLTRFGGGGRAGRCLTTVALSLTTLLLLCGCTIAWVTACRLFLVGSGETNSAAESAPSVYTD